jgi:hypothetical protein
VMDAIQRLRASARTNGRLTDTPQQRVVVDQQAGQSAIEIQPADPQMVYAPVYNPAYVWGPPIYGAYPPLLYPAPTYGISFAVGTFLGGLFAGLAGFGGWGWGLSWLTHGLFLNGLFFSHFGFHGGYGFGGYGWRGGPAYAAHAVWSHDPAHRLGVPYGNRAVAARFGGSFGGGVGGRAASGFAPRSESRPSYQTSNRQTDAYRGLTNRESGYRANDFRSNGNYGGYGSGDRGGFNSLRGNNNFASRGSSSFRSSDFRSSSGSSGDRGFSSQHSSEPHYAASKSSGHFGGGGGGHVESHGHSGGAGGHSGGGHSHGGGHHK